MVMSDNGAEVPTSDAWQVAAALAAPQIDALRHSVLPGAGARCSRGTAGGTPPPAAGSLPPPPLHILRSSQADAVRLDAELGAMLQEQLGKLFEHFSPGRTAELEPEMGALLSLLVFALSVWPGRATPGSELLNLRYRNERAVAANPKLVGPTGVGGPGLSRGQRIALGLGGVALPYAWARLGRAAHAGDWAGAEEGSWRRAAWRAMRGAEGALAAAAAANSWAFLVRGDYRSLLERLVGARLVWRQAAMTRIISFEYLNRQLLWQQTAEALLLLLPLVDLARLRRAALRLLPRPAAAPGAELAPQTGVHPEHPRRHLQAGAAGKASRSDHEGPQQAQQEPGSAAAAAGHGTAPLRVGPCPLCAADEPLTAVVALPCRHVFCYYCLRSNTAADPWFSCPRDGVRVAAMRRPKGAPR